MVVRARLDVRAGTRAGGAVDKLARMLAAIAHLAILSGGTDNAQPRS
jgi:hypothetical protein